MLIQGEFAKARQAQERADEARMRRWGMTALRVIVVAVVLVAVAYTMGVRA